MGVLDWFWLVFHWTESSLNTAPRPLALPRLMRQCASCGQCSWPSQIHGILQGTITRRKWWWAECKLRALFSEWLCRRHSQWIQTCFLSIFSNHFDSVAARAAICAQIQFITTFLRELYLLSAHSRLVVSRCKCLRACISPSTRISKELSGDKCQRKKNDKNVEEEEVKMPQTRKERKKRWKKIRKCLHKYHKFICIY